MRLARPGAVDAVRDLPNAYGRMLEGRSAVSIGARARPHPREQQLIDEARNHVPSNNRGPHTVEREGVLVNRAAVSVSTVTRLAFGEAMAIPGVAPCVRLAATSR